MDQNFQSEIFAGYKYTLNELLVRKKCFSIRLIVCEIGRRRVLPEVKLYDVRRPLGVNFSRHVLAKTATMQRINASSIFNLMPSNLASS